MHVKAALSHKKHFKKAFTKHVLSSNLNTILLLSYHIPILDFEECLNYVQVREKKLNERYLLPKYYLDLIFAALC